MTEPNHQPQPDLLDAATAALRDTPVPLGPSDRLASSTVEALQTLTPSLETLRRQQRRKLMFRIARYGSLATAAAVLLFLGTAFFLTQRVAFADVVENVKKAKAVNFTCKQKVTPNSPMLEQKWFVQGDFMRLEMPGIQEAFRAEEPVILAVIADFKEKKGLQIDYPTKTAKWLKFDEKMTKQFVNPIDQLRKLKDQDAERAPDEELDGRKVQVYLLKKLDFFGGKGPIEEGESFKVWVDPKSGLPVRIVIEGWNSDKKGKQILTFSDFTWNQPVAAEMFKLEVPKGFTVKEE